MRRGLSALVWALAALNTTVCGAIAGLFALMATSLDPIEMVSAGIEPWIAAVYATLGFIAALALTAIALRLWHSQRFKPVGLALTGLVTVGVALASSRIYTEYF